MPNKHNKYPNTSFFTFIHYPLRCFHLSHSQTFVLSLQYLEMMFPIYCVKDHCHHLIRMYLPAALTIQTPELSNLERHIIHRGHTIKRLCFLFPDRICSSLYGRKSLGQKYKDFFLYKLQTTT